MPVSRAVSLGDISLELPAAEESLLIVRLAASGAAGSFDMDAVEDIKTAANEACYLMLHQPLSSQRLRVVFTREDAAFVIRVFSLGERIKNPDRQCPDPEVCKMILETMTDDAEIEMEEGRIDAIRLSKKLP